jgi:hypothetical protein
MMMATSWTGLIARFSQRDAMQQIISVALYMSSLSLASFICSRKLLDQKKFSTTWTEFHF